MKNRTRKTEHTAPRTGFLRMVLAALAAILCLNVAVNVGADDEDDNEYTTDFYIENCTFSNTGANLFFSLEPGSTWYYEGDDEGTPIAKLVTVLPQTKRVKFETEAGPQTVLARVLKEEEWEDDELTEISFNYYARCRQTNDMFYFGEEVDIYEDGEVVAHDGAWEAGVDDAVPGIIMPGRPLVGSKYFQEIAPGVALDRADHTEAGVELEVEAGEFERCITILEDSPLEPGATSEKVYCPRVGLTIDDELELVAFELRPTR